MTGFLTNAQQNAILATYLNTGGSAATLGTASTYMGLSTASTGMQSAGTVTGEPTIGTASYARVTIATNGTTVFGAPSSGSITNSAGAITFPTAGTGGWSGTLAYWFLSISASTATCIMFGGLSTSVTVAQGQAPTFATSQLTLNASGW